MEKMSDSSTRPKFDLETKIKLLLALINDEGKSKLEASLEKLVSRLSENLENYESVIKKYLVKSILYLPLKTGIYANLLSRLKQKNNENNVNNFIMSIFGDLAHNMSDNSTASVDPFILRRYIRFIFECFNYDILELNTLKNLIELILNGSFGGEVTVNSLENNNQKIMFIYQLILNLPFLIDHLNAVDKDYLASIVKRIEEVLSNNTIVNNPIYERFYKSYKGNGIDSETNGNIIDRLHYIKFIWEVIKTKINDLEKNTNVNTSKFLLQISQSPSQSDKINIDFEDLTFASDLITNNYIDYISSEDIFSRFKDNFTKYDLNQFDRVLMRIYTEEITMAFHNKMELCLQYINMIPQFFGVIAESDFYNYNSDDLSGNKDLVFINYSSIETIFTKIIQIKDNINISTFYPSLIYYLRKGASPNRGESNLNTVTRSSIVSEFMEVIVRNISDFDVESVQKFSQFLTFYIPNLQLKYDFRELDLLATKTPTDINSYTHLDIKSHQFLSMTINRLASLTGHVKAEESLKEYPTLLKFIGDAESPVWKFTPNEQFYADTLIIIDYIKSKREYSSWSENFESKGATFAYVLMSCLLYARHKTLTHLRDSLNFYLEAIKENVQTKERQINLLNALFDVWGHSPTLLKFLLEYFFNNNLLDHIITIKFIFSDFLNRKNAVLENLNNYLYFDLICFTISNAENLLNRLRDTLVKQQETLAISDESSQAEIIKQIEDYETQIDKLSGNNDVISAEVLGYYFNLYAMVKGSEGEKHVMERIMQLCGDQKKNILRNFQKVEAEYENLPEKYENLQVLKENFKSI